MSEFAKDLDGLGLLRLVSRGQALIAELLRLSDNLPADLQPTGKSKFSPILIDFRYLKSPEHFEDAMETNAGLAALDDEFREKQGPLLERFLGLFDGCIQYHQDLVRYLDDLQEGVYIQSSVESVLANEEGRQLLVEALQLQGLLLLLLDHRLPGNFREQLLVAVYRHRGGSELPNFDSLCLLCRNSSRASSGSAAGSGPGSGLSMFSLPWGSASSQETPLPHMLAPQQADEYFSRFPLPKPIVKLILGRLKSEDLYSTAQHYPDPEQRTTALAAQAACVVVLLFYVPETLHTDASAMQEAVQRYFHSSWVVPLFMGFALDLQQAWEGYRAAKAALAPVVALPAVRPVALQQASQATKLCQELAELLSEGVLTAEYALRHVAALLRTIRNCNAALRWLLLHRCSSNRRVREAVAATARPPRDSQDPVLHLLLDTARLEFAVSRKYREVLDSKEERWRTAQQQAANGMRELADVFSGAQGLSKKMKDANLERWFSQMAAQVSLLDDKGPSDAGRKIQHMIAALREVEHFHQIESSLGIKQQLHAVRTWLQEMALTLGAKEGHLATLAAVSDAAYAWDLLARYTAALHVLIREDPRTVGHLHCLFLKLRSGLDLPLLRITQSGSEDALSVSQYYSEKLLSYTRSVLAVIPATMLSILNEAMAVRTTQLQQIPARLEKEHLRSYAQTEERLALAQATHRIAVFTQGILGMEKTLLGVIELDPREVLEEGIRRQLRQRVVAALQATLGPASGGLVPVEEVEKRLQSLATSMAALQRAVEYFQDFVRLQGLQLWQEEVRKVMEEATLQEFKTQQRRSMGRQPGGATRGSAGKAAARSTNGEPGEELTFIGRLHLWLLQLSSPTRTMYLAPLSGWYDANGQEQVGLRTMALLHASLGEAGLGGLDHLLGLTALQALRRITALVRSLVAGDLAEQLSQLASSLGPYSSEPEEGSAIYTRAVAQHVGRASLSWTAVTESVAQLGQVQLLRRLVALQLRSASTVAAGDVAITAHSLGQCMLADITNTRDDGAPSANEDEAPAPRGNPRGKQEGDLEPLKALVVPVARQLEALGQHSPASEILVADATPGHLALVLFLLTLWLLPKYVLDPHLAALASRSRKGAIDCVGLVAGVATILNQFHPIHTTAYVQLMGQYINMQVKGGLGQDAVAARKDPHDMPPEASNAVAWLHLLARHLALPRALLDSTVAPYLLSRGRVA